MQTTDQYIQEALKVVKNTKDETRKEEIRTLLIEYIIAKNNLDLKFQQERLNDLSVDLSKAQPFDMGNREIETGAFL